jgi:carboxypeptidase PM20D1
MYEGVCDACLRFSPFVADADEIERGVHGTNERITRRSYLQGIRFLIRLVQEALL